MNDPHIPGKIDLDNLQLRRRADSQLSGSPAISHDYAGKSLEEIIHELQVHQIELTIQNEELKKVHQDLEASRDRYQTLFDYAPVGYVTLTPEALINQVNLTGAAMLDVPRQKLQNKRFRRFIAPEHLDQWDRFFLQVLHNNEKQITNIFLVPVHDEVIATRIEGVRVLSDDNQYYAHLVISDISERRRIEMELQESEERFRMLFQHISSISVQGYGPDGTTRYWNEASEKLYGYSADEAIGKNLLDLIIPPDMRNDVRQAIAYMADTGDPIPSSELSLMRKDGKRVPVFSSHTLIHRSGYDPELFCVDIDLTDLKQTEEALLEANKKIKLLSGLTRHDIINHIAALSVTLGMTEKESNPTIIHQRVSSALDICNRMEATIGFTREYETVGMISSGWHLIYPIIDSAISELSLEEITIINNIPDDLEIYAEPVLRKVFATLMENSVRHGGNISKIWHSSQEREGQYIIFCEDDGVGIPENKKELIFDHGYGSHTGIGLFLAREILSITGLTIRECGIEGKGARFEITIPAGKFRRTA